MFKPLLEYCIQTGELRFDEPNRKDEYLSIKLHPIRKETFQKRWMLPVTSVYRSSEDENHFKQIFMICFGIGDSMIQSFEVEVEWDKQGPCCMNLSNAKLIFNATPKKIVSNWTPKGIDGFSMLSQDDKWYTFKRSRPFQFSFKCAVSYSRYAKFYESEDGQLKYWMIESQLTDDVIENQDNTS